jgi:predicted nucleic acid-binding Zn ribbon protein
VSPTPSKPKGPQPLGEVLTRFLSRSGLAAKVEAASVVPEWVRLVGPQIAAVTEPLRVSDGRLFVAVDSSAWIMELNMMKSRILRNLNAGKRSGRIEQLVFVMRGEERAHGAGRGEAEHTLV